MPAEVCLRDYNYRIPNLTLEVSEVVDPDGHGVVVDYGSHFRTPQEGRDLARVRAQELLCRKQVFEGDSDSVHLTAGAVFDLTDHFYDDFNAGYLVTWIEHEATQAIPGIAGPDHQTSYRNRFECQPKAIEFRPARVTPKPVIAGLSNAVVDAAGSGHRAEIDVSGRYKVRQQFDQRGEAAGQASRYIRKAEPYGGAHTGMHFPLLKDTEVILACVNGDPDRPIIVGAMQTQQFPSVVTSVNATKNRIRTTSGSLFEIDDGPASPGGGTGAGTGAALAPQQALEGSLEPTATATKPNAQSLIAQRAETDLQTTGGASSSYARLHIIAVTDSYWRLGSKPGDTDENTRKPGMSDMSGGNAAGGAGLFEYTVGDRSSLIKGSSYSQVDTNRLDYIKGDRRISAANHNAAIVGNDHRIAGQVIIEATKATVTASGSPDSGVRSATGAGDVVIKSANNFKEIIGGSYTQSVAGDGITRTTGTKVSQTWGSTADFMMGSAIKMTLGSALVVNLGATTTIVGALKVDAVLGMEYKLRIGPAFETVTSAKVDITPAQISSAASRVATRAAEVCTNAMVLYAQSAVVQQSGIVAAAGAMNVAARAMTVLT